MFDVLEKYKNWDHFFFCSDNSMADVCNAPTDNAGVYLVYALKKGRIELVYIGRSGKLNRDGTLFIRKGGIKDRLVNGKRDGMLRTRFWRAEMINEEIEVLDIYWYVTESKGKFDCPDQVEDILLRNYKSIYGQRPKWNRT
ncbi:hypothetical protein CJD36_014630 [Flavipsychrobacter stenotrophus]|uniref:GIY-YIG domain-containing protein n=1 Tax=Flavipsychrobacter stenotrophus TaxID=2077091 RepID=A0A2S7STU2_9BACT|nr:hypothetical protein [Flavipsychrobacter stenotrophus]PQJ09936.1 hypothetical protein CJD36_014630 [Flavipsychrobacter stenotrophus]